MVYIDMIGVRMVCRILCKCYACLIIAHDGCWSFLHVSHIYQKLPKPNGFLPAMTSGHILRPRCIWCNNWLLPRNNSNADKKTYAMVDSWSFASHVQSASQNPLNAISLPLSHNLKFKVPFKYLMMHFTPIQCGGLACNMNWLTVLTANARLTFHTHHCIYERSYLGLLWNIFLHFSLYIQNFLIRKL